MKSVRVFAPASVANVIVGFDFMGFAVDVLGDAVTVTRTSEPGVCIKSVRPRGGLTPRRKGHGGSAPKRAGAKAIQSGRRNHLPPLSLSASAAEADDFSQIPIAPQSNTATAGVLEFMRDQKMNCGFEIEIEKGIPLGSGLGGSAASAVATIVAVNEFLRKPLPRERLLRYAVTGEAVASGARHADNIAPSLLGGWLLASPDDESVIRIPVPTKWSVALLHPGFRLDTKKAREVLPTQIDLKSGIKMASRAAMVVASLCQKRPEQAVAHLRDDIIESARAPLIPHFYEIKNAAFKAGAYVSSISGAGPTVFALGPTAKIKKILAAMREASHNPGGCRAWVCQPSAKGARVLWRQKK